MAGVGPLGALTPGFKEDLLGLFKDIPGCLFSCFCFPIVASQTRTHLDGNEWGWCDCCCGPSSYTIRRTIRKKNNAEEDALKDAVAVLCCPPCVAYQNAKESGAKIMPEGPELQRL